MQLCGSLNILWHCPSWVLERKLIFSSLVAIVVFQIHWHIECNALTRSSLGIWNSSAGFLSPPLALFIVMLPKVHLTSHSRMSGSKQVTTPSWLSRSWRLFFFCYLSVYFCHLFLVSSACYVLKVSVLYHTHPSLKCSLDISSFLEEISSLSHSIVFLYLFALLI